MNLICKNYGVVLLSVAVIGAVAFIGRAVGVGQTYQVRTTITDSSGNTLATATTQFSIAPTTQASTGTGTQPNSKGQSSGSTTSPSPGDVPSIAVYPGQTYESDRWRATFSYDANGFPQPPAVPANAVWMSDPTCPWHHSSADYTNLRAAQDAAYANGSFYICICDGSHWTNNQVSSSPGTWNVALQIPGGTQSHPVVITRMGPDGYQDHTYPRPVIYDQVNIGGHRYGWASDGKHLPPMNYYEFFGLDFYGDKRDPASSAYSTNLPDGYQQYAFAFADGGLGQSDHFLISNCRIRYYMSAFAFQSDGSPNGANYTINTVWIDHPVCVGCYGSRFFGYDSGVKDLLVLDPVFDTSGWNYSALPKDGSGMEHCWYSNNANVVQTTDPQHRFVGGIFARPESMGIKQACGGLDDDDLFLACPIGVIGIQYNTEVQNCVFDGDNSEFDPLTSAMDLGTTNLQQGVAGLALSDGNVGTVGHQIGQERGWGLTFVTVPVGSAMNNLFIDKNDPINNGPAIQITTIDSNDTGVNPPKVGSFTLSGNLVHDWTQGGFNATAAGPNAVVFNLANKTGTVTTAMPAVSYSGNIFPGVAGITGIAGVEPAYVDPSRNISTYAKSLGVAGVTDGPSWLARAEQNWSGNFDARFTATAANAWIRAGFVTK